MNLDGHTLIRPEMENDRDAVHALNVAAFETPAEARLVDILREQAKPVISLVAEVDGKVAGHILFTPVTLSTEPDLKMMGLAPMAVVPGHQKQGIGSALVRAGLEQCGQMGFVGVVVLGHPEYYPRFGFAPSSRFGMDSEYDVPEDVFMTLELKPEALRGKTGRVKYHAAFNSV
ncbi:MAG: N-acetyltransferase [Candidatus Krumholzibacteria bacterium]|nr:N-acetyltransferase [Candidatus Krumholzibacteria bacterium]